VVDRDRPALHNLVRIIGLQFKTPPDGGLRRFFEQPARRRRSAASTTVQSAAMGTRRPNGVGWLERSRDRRGYTTLRGKARWRGDLYTAPGVGIPATVLALPPGRRRDRALAELTGQAQRALDELIAGLKRGERPDRARERRPLIAQARAWLEAKRPRMTPNSRSAYHTAVERHLAEHAIARVPMGRLDPEDVDGWLASLAAAGASRATQLYAYNRLLECLRAFLADSPGGGFAGVRAIVDGARVRRPKHRKQRIQPLVEAQALALVRRCLSPAARAAHGDFATAFGLNHWWGLRFGELAGLTWGAVHGLDWPGGQPTLHVLAQLDRGTRQPVDTKSAAGERVIPLEEEPARLLREHRDRCRAAGRPCLDTDPLFLHPSRDRRPRPLGYDTARKHLAKLAEEAGLAPSGKTHALRRTFGSLAASEGVGVPDLQAVMGHADAATTLIYTAPMRAGSQRVTAAVGRRLRAAGGGDPEQMSTAKDTVPAAAPT
jgi:integrase